VLQPQNLAPPTLFASSFKLTVIVPGDAFHSAPANASSNNAGPSRQRLQALHAIVSFCAILARFRQMQRLSCQIPVILMETCCPIIVAPTDGAGKNQNARGSVFEVPCGKWSRFVGTCSTTTSYTKLACTGEFLFR